MVYVILADGFEEIETFGTIDILRRCGLNVQIQSITGKRVVTSARGIIMKVDSLFRKNHLVETQALIFPGGLKNAETLTKNAIVRQVVQNHVFQGTLVAAICAAPMMLGKAEVLNGVHATIYPGMQSYLGGAIYHNDAYVVQHDNIITAAGPAATQSFAFTIARYLLPDAEVVNQVERDMLYKLPTAPESRVLNFHGGF